MSYVPGIFIGSQRFKHAAQSGRGVRPGAHGRTGFAEFRGVWFPNLFPTNRTVTGAKSGITCPSSGAAPGDVTDPLRWRFAPVDAERLSTNRVVGDDWESRPRSRVRKPQMPPLLDSHKRR